MFFVPIRRAGACDPACCPIVGAPSIHMFGLLFLILRRMLEIRRDISRRRALSSDRDLYGPGAYYVGTILAGSAFALSGRVPLLAAAKNRAIASRLKSAGRLPVLPPERRIQAARTAKAVDQMIRAGIRSNGDRHHPAGGSVRAPHQTIAAPTCHPNREPESGPG